MVLGPSLGWTLKKELVLTWGCWRTIMNQWCWTKNKKIQRDEKIWKISRKLEQNSTNCNEFTTNSKKQRWIHNEFNVKPEIKCGRKREKMRENSRKCNGRETGIVTNYLFKESFWYHIMKLSNKDYFPLDWSIEYKTVYVYTMNCTTLQLLVL